MNSRYLMLLILLTSNLLNFTQELDEPFTAEEEQKLKELDKEMEYVSTKNLLEQAQQDIAKGKIKEAKEKLLEVIERTDDPVSTAKAFVQLAEDFCIGIEGNYDQAFQYYEFVGQIKEAPEEQIKAWRRSADLYAEGSLQVPRNEEAAVNFYEELAKQKLDGKQRAWAWYQLGVLHLRGIKDWCDPHKAAQYFKNVLEQNDDKRLHGYAWYKLAHMATCGVGPIKKDMKRVVNFLSQAAGQHDDERIRAKALLRLGTIHLMDGEDYKVLFNPKRCYDYLQQVVTDTHDTYAQASAYEILAHMHLKGYEGVPRDIAKGMNYLEVIGDKQLGVGDQQIQAYVLLGDIYRDGEFGIAKNEKKAIEYYQKAAKCSFVLNGNVTVNKRFEWIKEHQEKAVKDSTASKK